MQSIVRLIPIPQPHKVPGIVRIRSLFHANKLPLRPLRDRFENYTRMQARHKGCIRPQLNGRFTFLHAEKNAFTNPSLSRRSYNIYNLVLREANLVARMR